MESLREIGQVSDIEETVTGSVRLRALKLPERISDTSNAESGSDVDDLGSPVAPEHVEYPSLAPVREEVKSCSVLPPFILTSDCFLGFTLDYVAFSLHI